MKNRIFNGTKLVIASHNKGKIKEIRDLLDPLKIKIFSAHELNIDEPDENGLSFEENAIIKSKNNFKVLYEALSFFDNP